LFVVSCFAFVTAGRWNDRFSPTALEGVPHLPKLIADPDLAIKYRQPPRWPAALSCSEEQDLGEEAATPGQPVRARARFWMIPRQFTLENHRLPLALPQSFS
jgi:hypothetical protein